jgi:hypothetical protein
MPALATDFKVTVPLGVFDLVRADVDDFLRDVADAIFFRSQELVPVDTGELAGSADVRKKGNAYRVVYDAPHAAKMEFGGRPEDVDIEDLIGWAERNSDRFGLRNQGEIKRFAWNVKRKIHRVGVDSQPYLRPAVDETKVRVPEIAGRFGV